MRFFKGFRSNPYDFDLLINETAIFLRKQMLLYWFILILKLFNLITWKTFFLYYRYFLHYQWVPFYVCSLAILYFFPYLIFKLGNSDMISLVDTVRAGMLKDVDKISNNYFNYKINSKLKMKLIIWFNIFVKVNKSFEKIQSQIYWLEKYRSRGV